MDTDVAMATDEICKLKEQCAQLEERLRLLERAVLCVLDSGEKVQVFKQCLQQQAPTVWSKVDAVTSVTTTHPARAAEPCHG